MLLIDKSINNRSPTIQETERQFASDKKSIDEFLEGKTKKFDFSAYKRLFLTELCYSGVLTDSTACGFTKQQIFNMSHKPERYGKQILKLSQYMYLKSGYYKRLVNYFAGLAKVCWTVDLGIMKPDFLKSSSNAIRNNLIRYVGKINSLNLEQEIFNMLLRIYLFDCCFGYLVESEYNTYIHYLDPRYCKITGRVNGSMFAYDIKIHMLGKDDLNSFPLELQEAIQLAKDEGKISVSIPVEKSICLKYHESFPYLYPPLFHIISDVLAIDDYKELSRAKTEQEAYRLLVMQIPTTDQGQVAMGNEIVIPFVDGAKQTVPESIGIIPSPLKVEPIQFKAEQTERNKVEEAIDQLYAEEGVSKSLMSGATSGSELKMSMIVDASDIYRIYRQIEKWVNLQMKLRQFIYSSYSLDFVLLDVTSFNQDEYIDRELKLTQASIPNKMRLCSACGINPGKLLGNQRMENEILQLGQDWMPLATSFTQSGSGVGGRPSKEDLDLSEAGEQTRKDEGNDKSNRI